MKTQSTENQKAKQANSFSFIETKSWKLSTNMVLVIGFLLALIVAIAVNFTTIYPSILLIGGVFAIVLFIAVLQRPEIGAYLLIFSVFTNLSDLFTEKGLPSINKPLVGILLLSIFVNYIFRTGKLSPAPKLSRIEIALFAYCTVVFASYFVAVNQPRAISYILDLMKDITTGVCIYLTLNTRDKWKSGARVLIFAVTFVSILGVIHTLTGTERTFWGFAQQSAFGQTNASGDLRFGGPIGESNIWGQVLVSIIPFALYRVAKEPKQTSKFIYLLASLFILLCVFFTESRGAFLALAAIIALIAMEMRIKSSTLTVAVIFGILFLFLLPSKYTERIKTLDVFFRPDQEYGLTQDESVEGRRNKMLTGLAMYEANPFLGVGFANYTDNYYSYAEDLGVESAVKNIETRREPHSLYIEIMAETGTFGILTFMAFLGLIFSGLYQVRKKYINSKSIPNINWAAWVTSILMSLLTFLIAGLFLHGIGFRYIWILAGMSLAFIHIAKSEPSEKQTFRSIK